jgi:hypothetical protein
MDRLRPWLRSAWLWLLIAAIAVVAIVIMAAPGCRTC